MVRNILIDMLEPIGYLPLGFLIGGIFLVFWTIYEIWFLPEDVMLSKRKKYVSFLCVVYIIVILYLAFFSREPGSRKGVDMVLFSTWVKNPQDRVYFLENILMFIPFGALFPMAVSKMKKGWFCVFCGFLFSVLLEYMQFVTQRGFCQLDDIVTNTVGTFIGWGIYRIILKRMK